MSFLFLALFLVLVVVPDHQYVENFYLAAIHALWVDLDGLERVRLGRPGDSPTHLCHPHGVSLSKSVALSRRSGHPVRRFQTGFTRCATSVDG